MGVAKISTNSGKIDLISYEDNSYTHKQIEKRNGIVFMRIKKRLIREK